MKHRTKTHTETCEFAFKVELNSTSKEGYMTKSSQKTTFSLKLINGGF